MFISTALVFRADPRGESGTIMTKNMSNGNDTKIMLKNDERTEQIILT